MDILARLDAEHCALIESMPDILDMTDVPKLRDTISQFMGAHPAAKNRFVRIEEHVAPASGHQPGNRCLNFRSRKGPKKQAALLWIHGGGMVYGKPEHDAGLCQHLAAIAKCSVFAVDYRLAPEHPFPAALSDCVGLYQWLRQEASRLKIDPGRIIIGGASAGAGLAAGACLYLRDHGAPSPTHQFLMYPMLDPRQETWINRPIDHHGVWHRKANIGAWKAYLGDTDNISPYAAPALANKYNRLPPTFLIIGDNDLFLDENMAYAHGLQRSGVAVDLHTIPGAFHASEFFLPDHHISKTIGQLRDNALQRMTGER